MRYIISGKNIDVTEGLRASDYRQAGEAGALFYS